MTRPGCGKKTKSGKHRKHTEIKSKKQQSTFGVAHAAQKGEIPMSKLRGPARQIAKSTTAAVTGKHLTESKGKKLPKRVKKR